MGMSLRLDKQNNEESVEIGSIRTDLDMQVRVGLDQETVQNYADLMRDGISFPKIMLFRDKDVDGYILIDGWHRLEAHKLAHPGSPIEAWIIDGTLEDARWFSCHMNSDHGLKRSNADKNRAVRLALQHPMGADKSNREIAKHVCVDEKLVRRVREELESTAALPQSANRTGRDGRAINTAKIGKVKKQTSVQIADEKTGPHPKLSTTAETPERHPVPNPDTEYFQPLTFVCGNAQETEKLICVPLDEDKLITSLFNLFDVQYREKVLGSLAREMLARDGKESVLKVITPLCDDIRKLSLPVEDAASKIGIGA